MFIWGQRNKLTLHSLFLYILQTNHDEELFVCNKRFKMHIDAKFSTKCSWVEGDFNRVPVVVANYPWRCHKTMAIWRVKTVLLELSAGTAIRSRCRYREIFHILREHQSGSCSRAFTAYQSENWPRLNGYRLVLFQDKINIHVKYKSKHVYKYIYMRPDKALVIFLISSPQDKKKEQNSYLLFLLIQYKNHYKYKIQQICYLQYNRNYREERPHNQ